jgi:TetR/AcrR family transcriptional repressor of nem operon
MSKGDDTKQRIIEKAAEMFNKKGYEGSSLSALMEATGLQKGGIYRHFSSKEELAADAFDYAWGAAREVRLFDLDVTAGAIPQLKQLIGNFVDRRGPVPGGCPLLNTAIDSDDGNPTLRERARKALCDWKDRLVGIITTGMKNAEIRQDSEPEELATLVISSLEGALMMSRIAGTNAGTNAAMRVVQKYLNRLLDDLARPAA